MFDVILNYSLMVINFIPYLVMVLLCFSSWLFCGFMLNTYIKDRENIHDGFYKHFYLACLHLPLTTFLTLVLFFYY